jgi:hypothetical protein
MRAPKLWETVLGLVFVVAVGTPGCGGDDSDATSGRPPTSSSTGGEGGAGGAGGTGGTGGTGGMGGAGGAGGGSADTGVTSTETVSGGTVTKSPNYKMVSTFGQPTQNQGTTTSPGYKMQGGLIGATASP